MLTATKSNIKSAYIAYLQDTYPFYTEGSKPLDMANYAVNQALAGRVKLTGICWDKALRDYGVSVNATMKTLSELPE